MSRQGLVFGLASLLLASGCGQAPPAPRDGKLRVLCSFFPLYVFTKNVVGDQPNVEVELMVPAEMGCPHDYDLKPDDVRRIAAANLFILNGAGLEEYGVKQVKSTNPKVTVVDTSKGIDLIEEAHDHDHEEGDEDHHHHHDHGGNPHFFSSPRMAAKQARTIAEALATADPPGAEQYKANAAAYATRLDKLAEEFRGLADKAPNKNIVTMHEVFDYLAKECGLTVVATVQATPGRDPSAGQMRRLVEDIRKKKPVAIFLEPQYAPKLGQTIAKDAGVPTYPLDPVASGPASAPSDYYETRMRENLRVLREALFSPAVSGK